METVTTPGTQGPVDDSLLQPEKPGAASTTLYGDEGNIPNSNSTDLAKATDAQGVGEETFTEQLKTQQGPMMTLGKARVSVPPSAGPIPAPKHAAGTPYTPFDTPAGPARTTATTEVSETIRELMEERMRIDNELTIAQNRVKPTFVKPRPKIRTESPLEADRSEFYADFRPRREPQADTTREGSGSNLESYRRENLENLFGFEGNSFSNPVLLPDRRGPRFEEANRGIFQKSVVGPKNVSNESCNDDKFVPTKMNSLDGVERVNVNKMNPSDETGIPSFNDAWSKQQHSHDKSSDVFDIVPILNGVERLEINRHLNRNSNSKDSYDVPNESSGVDVWSRGKDTRRKRTPEKEGDERPWYVQRIVQLISENSNFKRLQPSEKSKTVRQVLTLDSHTEPKKKCHAQFCPKIFSLCRNFF